MDRFNRPQDVCQRGRAITHPIVCIEMDQETRIRIRKWNMSDNAICPGRVLIFWMVQLTIYTVVTEQRPPLWGPFILFRFMVSQPKQINFLLL